MQVKEHYKKADLQMLVETIETPEDYTDETVNVAINELNSRNPNTEDVKEIATKILANKARKDLENFSPVNDELAYPTSYFLNRNEVVEIFKIEFKEHMSRRQQMKPDSWNYILGAGI